MLLKEFVRNVLKSFLSWGLRKFKVKFWAQGFVWCFYHLPCVKWNDEHAAPPLQGSSRKFRFLVPPFTQCGLFCSNINNSFVFRRRKMFLWDRSKGQIPHWDWRISIDFGNFFLEQSTDCKLIWLAALSYSNCHYILYTQWINQIYFNI